MRLSKCSFPQICPSILCTESPAAQRSPLSPRKVEAEGRPTDLSFLTLKSLAQILPFLAIIQPLLAQPPQGLNPALLGMAI